MRRFLTTTALGCWMIAGGVAPALAQTAPAPGTAKTPAASAAKGSAATKGLSKAKIQTLADIQADIARVKAEVLGLKKEFQPTGLSVVQSPASKSVQSRLDAIDGTLQQLTNQTELLQNRINRVVADGTNRIGDLEFRLTEAAGGDISKLGPTKPLGGPATGGSASGGTGSANATSGASASAGAAAGGAAAANGSSSTGPELAVGEQGDFNTAKAALAKGSYKKAAQLFSTFAQTYTGGPLTGEALFYQGAALSKLGDTANAARAYLNSFSGYPQGKKAPDALTELGVSLGKLGQTKDACVTLGQVSVRYPNASAVADAAKAMQQLGCQ